MSKITISGGGVFTSGNVSDINSNFTELYAGSSGGTFSNPTITGTVAGGASYTGPTLTSPTITGTTAIGAGATLTSPTLVTPALGTPASGVLSSCTAYPLSALTGAGTGVLTILAAGKTGTGNLVADNTPTLITPVLGAATGTSVNLSGDCRAATFHAGATAGVTAGPFTAVSSIQTIAGIVTVLTGT